MIKLVKNQVNNVRLTLFENNNGSPQYYGLLLVKDESGDANRHWYSSLTDVSTYPEYYNEFRIGLGNGIQDGTYRYEAYSLFSFDDPDPAGSATPIETGRAIIVESTQQQALDAEVVFTTAEENNRKVFDED